MNKKLCIQAISKTLAAILFLSLFVPEIVPASDYMLIVNVENTYPGNATDAKILIKQLYTKLKSTWPTVYKLKARAIDRANNGSHSAFLKYVLKMSDSELASYWLSLKQKTGETPPRSIKSTRMALKFVAKNKGAFTMIKKKEEKSLGKGVKVLFEF